MNTRQETGGPGLERRQFLKSSALFGAGLFLAGAPVSGAQAQRGAAALLYGEGGITSIAIADDCARLARHASGIEAAVKSVLERSVNREYPGNAALIGGMVPMDADEAVTLLGRFRERWADRGEGDGTEEKLALVMGWMMQQAARRQLRPLYEEAEPSRPGLYPSDMSLYHDAAILRHRSSDVENAGRGVQVEAVAQLFREMAPRILVRFHTLIPDYDDGSGWVDRISGWRHRKETLLHRLAEAYQDPDPEKRRRYVTEPTFYDEEDAVIRVVEALRDGGEPQINVEEAVAASNRSHYAQALIRGYGHLEAASIYFSEGTGEQALRNRLRS